MDAQETSIYTAVLITSIVLGIIITYFVISIIRQQRRTVDLYKKSIYTEINTLEKERSRVAADLHDEVGPVLSAVKLRINSLDIHNKEDEEEIQKTNEQIDSLLKRMREISFDLMPSSLLRRGLAAALNEFIDYCSRNNRLQIHFTYSEVALTQTQAINLYRIVQEIIHNTVKHADARELVIELKTEESNAVLTTRDDGKGFNYESRSKEATGLGLQNLLRRTEIISGKMYIESKKGKGTTYIFEVPLNQHESNKTDQAHTG